MNDPVSLGPVALGIAASLILVNVILSLLMRLQLERALLIAAVRSVVQLILVGYVLATVFALHRWEAVVGIAAVMTAIAGHAASQRATVRYRGLLLDSTLAIGVSSWLVVLIGLTTIFRNHPWYEPQYAIPILGMVLGNALTGVSLGLERVTSEFRSRRAQIEAILALGGTRYEAAHGAIVAAVRSGMMPAINAMSVVGIVSLPGMMTGQVLAGQPPEQAVRYQMVILFLIAAASALGTVLAVGLAYRKVFSDDHRFLHERLHAGPSQ